MCSKAPESKCPKVDFSEQNTANLLILSFNSHFIMLLDKTRINLHLHYHIPAAQLLGLILPGFGRNLLSDFASALLGLSTFVRELCSRMRGTMCAGSLTAEIPLLVYIVIHTLTRVPWGKHLKRLFLSFLLSSFMQGMRHGPGEELK